MTIERHTMFLIRDEAASRMHGKPVYERVPFAGKLRSTLPLASAHVVEQPERELRIIAAIELAPGANIDLLCLSAGHIAEGAGLRDDQLVWINVAGTPRPFDADYPLVSQPG